MAPLPDSKHLLELLQRAAEELKGSQKETAAAKAEVKSLQDKLAAAEVALAEEKRQRQELDDERGGMTLPPRPEFTAKTVGGVRSPLATDLGKERPREEKTSVGSSDDAGMLSVRVEALQKEIEELAAERKQLKDRIRTLEGDFTDPTSTKVTGELEHELANTRQQLIVEQARGADLMTRLQAWEKRSQELEQQLSASHSAAEAEHQQLDQLAGQLSQVETELTTEKARTQALEEQLKSLEQGSSDEQKKLFEATTRVAQLEVEVNGLKARRDELNLEIGKVEKERNAARTKVTELEAAAQQVKDQLNSEHAKAMEAERANKAELEQQLAMEKQKHQITAQKLLEARGKGKETDEKLSVANTQNAELISKLDQQTAAHAAELSAAAQAQTQATAQLTAKVAELTAQLETATTEWRYADKQYETLHGEMMVILDQRDEARRELDTIKQRFGLR